MSENSKIYGLLAQFETTADLYNACKEVQTEGFTCWDAYSPFPVHGLDKVMKLPQSKLPWIVGPVAFVFGSGGYITWSWMNAVDYKFVIAGKPFYSWPAYFLPGFECAVLSAAFACLIGMLVLNKMEFYHPLHKVEMFQKATDNKFFISIQSNDPKFDLIKTQEYLKNIGASNIETMEE